METRLIMVYREGDVGNVIEQIRNQHGIICGTIIVPFWNIYGQPFGKQTAVIYQSEKEPAILVQC